MRIISFSMIVLVLLVGSFQTTAAQSSPDLSVSISGSGSLIRTYDWGVNLTSDDLVGPSELVVTEGQDTKIKYSINVTRDEYNDRLNMSGEVCINNTGTVQVSDFSIRIDFGKGTMPYYWWTLNKDANPVIAPGEQICYPWALETPMNIQTDGSYYVEAYVITPEKTFQSAQELLNLSVQTVASPYESITVAGPDGKEWVFTESGTVHFKETYTCSDARQFTKSVEIVETGKVSSLSITIICTPCVHDSAYWKNHPEVWNSDGMFFLTDMTNLEMLTAPVKGDAYYMLAKEYITASQNVANGAYDPMWVNRLIHAAFWYLNEEFGGFPPFERSREDLLAQAKVLQDFNHGKLGPAPCTGEP